ncbi:hypothetical protein AB0D66_30905 [Streptomyces sp. NPDC048270]|uniref:hypothetical protein n=1 Tax=Streptomyces sp. NPDC048270 TaxID=3154615 RepID=UPI0033DB94D9
MTIPNSLIPGTTSLTKDIETPPGLREPAVDYQRASREALELIGTGTSTAFLVELQEMAPRLHMAEFTEREVRAILDSHRRIRAAGPCGTPNRGS